MRDGEAIEDKTGLTCVVDSGFVDNSRGWGRCAVGSDEAMSSPTATCDLRHFGVGDLLTPIWGGAGYERGQAYPGAESLTERAEFCAASVLQNSRKHKGV